ncbi:MAG: hypothetical protein E6Q97_11525 [Desulfurellales bacterium]|nr:MAG: hypothetical protein E6Q97_11525 [Desulfurellales bacterium]
MSLQKAAGQPAEASPVIVGIKAEVCQHFGFQPDQLFRLAFDGVIASGDYVFVAYQGQRLFAIAGRRQFQTTMGDLPKESARVLARATPISE